MNNWKNVYYSLLNPYVQECPNLPVQDARSEIIFSKRAGVIFKKASSDGAKTVNVLPGSLSRLINPQRSIA